MGDGNDMTKAQLAKFMKELHAREAHLSELEDRYIRRERELEAEGERIREEAIRAVEDRCIKRERELEAETKRIREGHSTNC